MVTASDPYMPGVVMSYVTETDEIIFLFLLPTSLLWWLMAFVRNPNPCGSPCQCWHRAVAGVQEQCELVWLSLA